MPTAGTTSSWFLLPTLQANLADLDYERLNWVTPPHNYSTGKEEEDRPTHAGKTSSCQTETLARTVLTLVLRLTACKTLFLRPELTPHLGRVQTGSTIGRPGRHLPCQPPCPTQPRDTGGPQCPCSLSAQTHTCHYQHTPSPVTVLMTCSFKTFGTAWAGFGTLFFYSGTSYPNTWSFQGFSSFYQPGQLQTDHLRWWVDRDKNTNTTYEKLTAFCACLAETFLLPNHQAPVSFRPTMRHTATGLACHLQTEFFCWDIAVSSIHLPSDGQGAPVYTGM